MFRFRELSGECFFQWFRPDFGQHLQKPIPFVLLLATRLQVTSPELGLLLLVIVKQLDAINEGAKKNTVKVRNSGFFMF